ncbi:MAG: glycosyltransferase family 4 protein [Rhizomicrobium sp.]|jgi:glycosyltransferase involved in cell wall biosynthesis
MRVLVLTDNFVPEQNAPALRTYEHCRRWVEEGVSVTVITTAPNFPTGKVQTPYRNWLYRREQLDGIDVVRVWSFLAPNTGVVLRALDFASFALSGALAGFFEAPDVIMATSPQLLTGYAGHVVARAKRRPWVFEVRDLWPESITAVEAMKDGVFMRMLARMERHLYRSADRIVTVTEPLRVRIAENGVPREKIGVVPNGANLRRLTPRDKSADLLKRLKLDGRFIVGYVGTHGMAQGLEVVLKAAHLLNGTDIHFLFVGEGARRKALMSMASALALDNVTFTGVVPSDVAVEHLALSDAIVIPLKNSALFEGALPSKIFEAAAMEKPIIVSANGISAETVKSFGAGLVAEPGDPHALAQAIKRLKASAVLREQCRAGCRELARAHDRDRLAKMMLAEIRRTVDIGIPLTRTTEPVLS